MFRERELPGSLDDVVKLFRTEFSLKSQKEFDALFEADPSKETAADFFFSDPPDRDELIALIGGVPEGPTLGGRSEDDLVNAFEQHVGQKSLLWLPPGFVRQFYNALKAQRFVVLAGRPGTGKTAFARAYASAVDAAFPDSTTEIIISVGQDFGDADAIGYERIAGGIAPTELTRQLFLNGRPKNLFFVILDEMNLAEVDFYLSRLLPAIESGAPVELPGQQERYRLPSDAYFIGTINSYIEENTRLPLSGPIKRRANVIEMPNTLDDIVARGAKDEFVKVSEQLLRQTLQLVQARQARGFGSLLDPYREATLNDALQATSPLWKSGIPDLLWELTQACARDRRSSITLGVLQDVLDYIAMARGISPEDALDVQIAQKLAPQLSGPVAVANSVKQVLDKSRTPSAAFERALRAVQQIIDAADPSSGLVIPRY
jgi:hypothetical protein